MGADAVRYVWNRYQRPHKFRSAMGKYFDSLTNANNLYEAYLLSKRGCSWKESVQKYSMYALQNIRHVQQELREGSYAPPVTVSVASGLSTRPSSLLPVLGSLWPWQHL